MKIQYQSRKMKSNDQYKLFGAERKGKIVAVWFGDQHTDDFLRRLSKKYPNEEFVNELSPMLIRFLDQATEYFAGKRRVFDVPMETTGTVFQKTVLKTLEKIPFGKTMSYGEIAGKIGKPKASIAVGQAVAKNPLSILIPCHRVLGSNGSLTGYAFGIDLKRELLEMEGVTIK